MNPIIGPQNLELTSNWYDIQHTNLHYYHPHISQEANKLLKSFGKGSYFVIAGYKLALFNAIVNSKQTCIARLTPGIHVQDFTVIDFTYPMRKLNKFIYIELFNEDDQPVPKQVYYLGSRYYHGIIGDGINAQPTYSIIQTLKFGADKTNFRTFYRLTLDDEYGSNGQIIDIPHIIIEDFRFPPNDTEPTDPLDPWKPPFIPSDPNNPEDDENSDEDDYTTLIARSQSIMWSMALNNNYSV